MSGLCPLNEWRGNMVEINATVDRYVFPNCKTTGVKMNPMHLTKTLHENVLPLVLFFLSFVY